MFKFIFFIALFFSPYVFSGSYYFGGVAAFWTNEGGITGGDVCGSTIEACVSNMPLASFISAGSVRTLTPVGTFSYIGGNSYYIFYRRDDNNSISRMQVTIYRNIEDGNECSSNGECLALAHLECESMNQLLSVFNYESPGNYSFECSDLPPDPADECEQNIVQQCTSHLGMASSTFTEDGLGGSSCFGTCNDGTDAEESCIETLANNYCDVVEPPSELDFGAGGSGSDVLPPSSTSADIEHDIDYEPDGSMVDPTAPFSALQGDKLINEVVKSRNDNTSNLASTTESTNQTIVEKSDDISNTVSNSANGIIDAINDIPPFYDGNIVQGMEQFSVKIENLADIFGNLKEDFGELKDDLDTDLGTDYVHTTQHASFANFDALFSADSGTQLEELVEGLQLVIKTESLNFQAALKDSVSIGSPSVGEYEQKSLELSGWGTFDISLSRFTALFGGLGNIIYFLAAMTAMTIVLGGIRL